MKLSSQKQVMTGLDRLSDGAVQQIAKARKVEVEKPVSDVINKASSNEGLLKRLDGGLLRKMDTSVIADSVEANLIHSTLVGIVTATPSNRKKNESIKSR